MGPQHDPGGHDAAALAELLGELLARAAQAGVDLTAAENGTESGAAARGGARPGKDLVRRPRADLTAARARSGEDLQVVLAEQAGIRAGVRARRAPWIATGVTAAAGWAATGIGELTVAGAGPAGLVIAAPVVAGLCAAAVGLLWLICGSRIPRGHRRRVLAGAAGASAWVTTCALLGADSWVMTALLVCGAAAASARWCREHAVPDPAPRSPLVVATPLPDHDEGVEVVEDLGAELARRWADHVARARGPAPGARLTGRDDLPRAIRWTIECPPGDLSFQTLFAARERIASGLRWGADKVLLEPSDVDASQAVLTVITRDLLAAGITYGGPRYVRRADARVVPLGPYADGSGEAEFVAVDRVGCRNGSVAGEPGSGKTASLEAIAMGLKSSGEWACWFGDGDPDGGSSPLLNELADWSAAGPDGVLAQLGAVEEALRVRGMLKATLTEGPDGDPTPITDPDTQRALRQMLPSPAYPGLMWIIDELHRLTTDPQLKTEGFTARLERIVRIGRKYGVVVVTGSQSLLVGDFGNSTPLRGYLAARNLFAFRNANKTEKAVVSGLEISPATLPPGGGYCYAAGAGRLAMARVAWAPDMIRWVPGLPTASLDADTDLATIGHRPTEAHDPAAAHAEQLCALAAWRQTKTSGTPTPAPSQPTPATAQAAAGPGYRSVPGLAGIPPVPAPLTAANVIRLQPRRPRPDEAGSTGEATAREPRRVALPGLQRVPADLDTLSTAQRQVLAALRTAASENPGAVLRTGEIAETTGLRLPAVSKALSALADLGLAVKHGHGEWAPARAA